jgi:hypothetical protein
MDTEFLYRYVDRMYASSIDEFDNPSGPPSVGVTLKKYLIIRRTPKGAWIDDYGLERFVLLTAHKKFACETPEEALQSFIARKERQLLILGNKTKIAQLALRLARDGARPGTLLRLGQLL